jgi:hypothetical protein
MPAAIAGCASGPILCLETSANPRMSGTNQFSVAGLAADLDLDRTTASLFTAPRPTRCVCYWRRDLGTDPDSDSPDAITRHWPLNDRANGEFGGDAADYFGE